MVIEERLRNRGEIDKVTQGIEAKGDGAMKPIMGTIRNGQIVADEPIEWLEGSRVVIEPAAESTLRLREEEWSTDPKESLGSWL
jgi:hypothetical protein